jgi:beta-xylosidase
MYHIGNYYYIYSTYGGNRRLTDHIQIIQSDGKL